MNIYLIKRRDEEAIKVDECAARLYSPLLRQTPERWRRFVNGAMIRGTCGRI